MRYSLVCILTLTLSPVLYGNEQSEQQRSLASELHEAQETELAVMNDNFFDEIDSLMDEAEHAAKMQQIRNEQPPSFIMVQLRYIGIALILKYIALRGYVADRYDALALRLKKLMGKQ